ncbi:MAG: hypothetical protein ABIT05_05470 [Chitinophagaceae bacterium]
MKKRYINQSFNPMKKTRYSALLVLLVSLPVMVSAQMITGVWKGKIDRQKVEIKIIQEGDSLKGNSYYYESATHYRSYSIRGYFDSQTNEAVWWDDQLLEERSGRFTVSQPGRIPMLSRANFNCPGGGKMMLDGQASKKEEETRIIGDLHLDKSGSPFFKDEWDFVIENYTVGANDPDLIDSIAHLSRPATGIPVETAKTVNEKIPGEPVYPVVKALVKNELPPERPQPAGKTTVTPAPLTIEEKFTSRIKTFIREIPVTGDSVELRFYDNAEIDGDSISLFLNDKLLFQHIRLTGNAYIIKLALSELAATNELIMVAENLGSIPPNTAYMVAVVNKERYEAYLASTEGSSAMIRLVKK